MVECVLPIDSLDSLNLQNLLATSDETPGANLSAYQAKLSDISDVHTFEVTTNFSGFSVSDDAGTTETYILGSSVVGNLDVKLIASAGDTNNSYTYEIKTPANNLTINTHAEYYQTNSANISLSVDGQLVGNISSSDSLQVIISADGAIQYSKQNLLSEVSIKIPVNNSAVKWDRITLTLTAISAEISPAETGLHISSPDGEIGYISAKADLMYSEIPLYGEVSGSSADVCAGSTPNMLVIITDGRVVSSVALFYSMAFFTGGGTQVTTISNIVSGGKVEAPDDPVYAGYSFDGWYTDPTYSDSSRWDFNTNTVTADTTLYAKWTEDTNYWKNIIFRAEGSEDQIIVAPLNSTIFSKDYPEVPIRDDSTGVWNAPDSIFVEDDMIIYATYTANSNVDYYDGSLSFDKVLLDQDTLIVNMRNLSDNNLANGLLIVASYYNEKMADISFNTIPLSLAGEKFSSSVSLSNFVHDYDTIRVFAVDNQYRPLTGKCEYHLD